MKKTIKNFEEAMKTLKNEGGYLIPSFDNDVRYYYKDGDIVDQWGNKYEFEMDDFDVEWCYYPDLNKFEDFYKNLSSKRTKESYKIMWNSLLDIIREMVDSYSYDIDHEFFEELEKLEV